MAGKAQRLGKAAGELNVGIATIVDFLSSKGVAMIQIRTPNWSRNNSICCVPSLLQTRT